MNAPTGELKSVTSRSKDAQELLEINDDYLTVVRFLEGWMRKSVRLCELLLKCNGTDDVEWITGYLSGPGVASNLFNIHAGLGQDFVKDKVRESVYFAQHETNPKSSAAWFTENRKFALLLSCDYEHEMILGGCAGRVKTTIPQLKFRHVFNYLDSVESVGVDPQAGVHLAQKRERIQCHLDTLEEIRSVTEDFLVAERLCEGFLSIPDVVDLFSSSWALRNFCAYTTRVLIDNCKEIIEFIDFQETRTWCRGVATLCDTVENVLAIAELAE